MCAPHSKCFVTFLAIAQLIVVMISIFQLAVNKLLYRQLQSEHKVFKAVIQDHSIRTLRRLFPFPPLTVQQSVCTPFPLLPRFHSVSHSQSR
jgi:hypothetical protein